MQFIIGRSFLSGKKKLLTSITAFSLSLFLPILSFITVFSLTPAALNIDVELDVAG